MDKLTTFIRRLKKIGIEVELFGNYPWIYLDSVNGNKITEKLYSEHGFTVAFMNAGIQFTDLTEIFKLIRKYK